MGRDRLEVRMSDLADELARKHGMTRRRFLETAAGMAAAFLVVNEVYGDFYDVSRAEARTPEMADARAQALSNQLIVDCHTSFARDDARISDDRKFPCYFKQMFLDSDTKVAVIAGSPSDTPRALLPSERMTADARARVNREAGSRRLLSHAIFAPGQPGWLEAIDRAIAELKPDSFEGATFAEYPWRMDDEKLAYKGYEKLAKAGLVTVCVHKGLEGLGDVGRAAKDWPQLNFVIHHSACGLTGRSRSGDAWARFEKTGRIELVTDLAEIPARYGVANVYADLGLIFSQTTAADPRMCAAVMGQFVRGFGVDRLVWATDAVWTGAPRWQIEALRRLEIPGAMQRKHGFAPLGTADGPVKAAILGENAARIYKYEHREALATDRITAMKEEYEARAAAPAARRGTAT